jgi:SAM-dependent MidA family methyltransferase
MGASARDILLERIRERGAITVAEFMDTALYHPEHGYYATAPRRSGRAGDFYTSVDVGPMFGEMIAVQLAEMIESLAGSEDGWTDLVEAGAADGSLMRDILDTLVRDFPSVYARVRVTLVERSALARQAQIETLAAHRDRVASSGHELPRRISGVILANELLDALPVHVIQLGEHEPREIYVTERDGVLVETTGPVSDDRIHTHLGLFGGRSSGRVEVGLAAIDWITAAAAALERGFLLLFDYVCEAGLYTDVRHGGTLVAYRQHTLESSGWLNAPGESDLTAHVNLGAIRAAAVSGGLTLLGAIDQSYFLMNLGLLQRLTSDASVPAIRQRIGARSLVMPGGLGSTMKVMVFGRGGDRIALRGFAAGRLT